ncbi:CBS domain-containing protein [Halovivax gelatinilyticus]|uniref:CBS domain-containing protein n=1 Tax=Halovivax gelatinilyticus TaxID=2961597 RepID=UPI0020CA42C4|nr:CBS domain-containing protein [Halovivax gelatinilyticus]
MDVTDVIDDTYDTVDEETPVSKLRGAFEGSAQKALLVTAGGEFDGIVTRRDAISSHEKNSRKARSLVRPVPRIGRHEDLREAARLMIAGDTRVLPVMDDPEAESGDVVGVVRADDLLRHVQPYLSVLDTEDVATLEVVTVEPETTLGKALATFREKRIEHLPVVADEDGENVVGIVSLLDVIQFVTRELTRQQGGDPSAHVTAQGGDHGGFGDRSGESADLLDLPVRNVMVETVGTTTLDESLDAALDTMLEFEASSSIVLDDGVLAGIVTKTDLLDALTWTEEGGRPIQVFGTDYVTELTHETMAERIDDVARKYGAMRVLEAKVHVNEHKERLRGVPQIHVRIRLYTDKGLFVASDTGYGDRHAFSLALNAIERQILEGKTYGESKKPVDDEEIARMYGWWLSE